MTEDMYRDHLELIDKTEEQLEIAIKLYRQCEKLGLAGEMELFKLEKIKDDLGEMWHIVGDRLVDLREDNKLLYDELEDDLESEEEENNKNI